MSFIKRILLGGAFATLCTSSAILLVSCSSQNDVPIDLGITPETEKYYGGKIDEKLAKDEDKTIVQRKTMLITAGGKVNDKSFNESVWGAIQLYEDQSKSTKKDTFAFRETTNDDELPKHYDYAIDNNYKTLVLTGFQQGAAFQEWLNIKGNTKKFEDSKAVIIGVDWDGSSFIPQGQFLGLGFKTEEASWIVAQAAADYLIQKGLNPHLNTFGGGRFDGVTDFNNGFLQGMLDWNKANVDNEEKKVKFYSGNKISNEIILNTGFDPTTDKISVINEIVGTGPNVPQIILPVAGSLSGVTLDNIKDKKSSQLIIGVDANQALVFPNDKERFFSSVEKRVAVGVYKAMVLLADIPLDYQEGEIHDTGFEGDFVVGKKNAYIKYGFDKGFVGYSESTLSLDDAKIANKALADAKLRFDKEVANVTDYFKPMTDADKNQNILNDLIKQINS